LSFGELKWPLPAADKPPMDVSSWSVGVGIGAVAAAAAGWAWLRQRRLAAELGRRLEESEHSRLDLVAHAQQVDDQLASMADALARQQAALARVAPGAGTPAAPVEALLRHLGDTAPVVAAPTDSGWLDTEQSAACNDADDDGPHPAFAETMPVEFDTLPQR
jgi:hypothetical protein